MSILHTVCAQGNITSAINLLENGDNPNRRLAYDGSTPLIYAAGDSRAGVEILKLLIQYGADPTFATTDNGQNALHYAAKSGDLDKVNYLLSLGLSADNRDKHGYSPMILAGWSKNHNVIKTLMAHGGNPYRATSYNETTVSACASDFNSLRLFDREKVMDILRWTPLIGATALESPAQMAKNIKDLSLRDKCCRTAWHVAIETGEIEKTAFLYQVDDMPMGEDIGLYPNVFYAIQHNHHEMLLWLIDIGADITHDEILSHTARYGASECLKILLEKGHYQQHQLDDAIAFSTNTETIKHLLKAGANINHVHAEGFSALRAACEEDDFLRVNYLLKNGVNPDIPDIGETPLIRAVSGDSPQIVKALIDAGANVNLQTNPDMWFALQYVRSPQVMQMLLDAGADTTLSDAGGVTAHRELWDERLVKMLD